jgi:cytochrome c553
LLAVDRMARRLLFVGDGGPMLRHLLLVPCALALAACSGAATPPKLHPSTIYLGVEDSGLEYAAPVGLGGASPMYFSVADASIATVSGGDQELVIDAVHGGSTTIVVHNDFGQATAAVSVATYTEAARLDGKQAWAASSCASCHDAGPDVTPSGIAGRSDAQIAAAVVSGVNPDGGQISPSHSFPVSSDGIVAFLRSLPAREIPAAH